MAFLQIIVFVLTVVFIIGAFVEFYKYRGLLHEVESQKKKADHRMYELAILKELGDRVGYSLDIDQIVDVISGSLHQFVEYSAVAYILIEPEDLLFKVHVERSVNRAFIQEMQRRMLESVKNLAPKESEAKAVKEVLSGAILVEELDTPLKSYFNIPLVIGNKVKGVLTVADVREGVYDEEEMTLLYKITDQASHAVSRLQRIVRTEQAKLNAMVATLTDGVLMTDKDFRIMVANPAVCEIVGKKRQEEVTIFDFVDTFGDVFNIHGRLEESIKLGKTFAAKRVELEGTIYDIVVLPVRGITAATVTDTLGGVVVFRDVTTIVESERMRDEFTSMLVHELRSPLDAIKSIAEVLRSGNVASNSEDFANYLTMIYQSSFQMLGLVNDILDVAKLESGKFEVHPEDVNAKEVITSRVNFYKPSAADANITLDIRIDPALPEAVYVDTRSLQQALSNFLSNALKFTQAGSTVTTFALVHDGAKNVDEELKAAGIILPISLSGVEAPSGIVVGVADEGVGIPEGEVEAVFDRFKQASGSHTSTSKKGTGLGLSIVRGVARAHGGDARLVSEEGKGTVALFMVPGKKIADTSTQAPGESKE